MGKVTDQIKNHTIITNGVEYVGIFNKTSDGKYSAILNSGSVTSIVLSEYLDWDVLSEHDSIPTTVFAVQKLVEG